MSHISLISKVQLGVHYRLLPKVLVKKALINAKSSACFLPKKGYDNANVFKKCLWVTKKCSLFPPFLIIEHYIFLDIAESDRVCLCSLHHSSP